MVRTVKYENESKELAVELQKELAKLKTSVAKLETNIGLLQSGENWNGANAFEVNQSLVGHFDHDNTLLNKLEKCSESLNGAIK